jgi:ABC-2 type transport system ATP-binding protein
MRISEESVVLTDELSVDETDFVSDVVGLTAVTRKYGTTKALAGVTLEVTHGVTVLLGRNGAGKSTLCRIIAGVERPDQGMLTRAGRPVEDGPECRSHHRNTGWLPQSFTAPGTMTVRQYVTYAGWLKDIRRQDLPTKVDLALERVDLHDLATRRLGQLSGGMLRRVGIAQAIVHHPSFIVLDEPTVGLDPEQRNHFHEIIAGVADTRSILISTHLLEDVQAVARNVVVLDAGRVLFSGSVDALVRQGQTRDDDRQVVDPLRAGFLSVVNGR